MSSDDDSTETPRITLEALAHELLSRCEAACRFSGGHTYYGEVVAIFRKFIAGNDLFAVKSPEELSRPPDDEGSEHQVWFRADEASYLKVTWPDFFGKLVVHASGEAQGASPIQYLERWHLHNELFGDKVEFLGAFEADSGLR